MNRVVSVQRRPLRRSLIDLAGSTFQLGGAVFFAALIPYVYSVYMEQETTGLNPALHTTFIAILVAMAMGDFCLREMSLFPGMKMATLVIPSFLTTFGIVAGILLISRIDYTRGLLLTALLVCCIWYVFVLSAARSARPMRIAVIPFGDVTDLPNVDGVDWVRLNSPTSPVGPVDGFVADFSGDLPDQWERMIAQWTLDGKIVYEARQLREAMVGLVKIDHLSENNLGSLMPVAAYLKIKLFFDIVLAIVLLPLVLIVLAVLYVAVRMDSAGPFIFRQERVGYRGKVFTVFKVRTMHVAEADGCDRYSAVTVNDDPRITRIGRILRRVRIDELPQIFNVLRGEMSWIGPRPEASALSAWYAEEIPFYAYRHVVRPGISGWAQVNQGHVAHVHEVHLKLQNDFYYIKYFSPWLDILIAIKTVATIATGFGAR